MPPPVKKRKFLTLEQKSAIIAEAAKGRKKSDIAEEYNIPCSSLSTILKGKDSIMAALQNGARAQHRTVATPVYEDIDKALFQWFLDKRANKLPLSGSLLQQKAIDFACMLGHDNFKASAGWLSRFKARHCIVAKVLSGESASVDAEAASSWVQESFEEILLEYQPSDIYNADETGFFYEMLPSKTLDLKGQKCHGGKLSKKRVTILLCSSMDGSDKRPLLVIGRSKKPRCFKGSRRLPVEYTANLKAWMTRGIFTRWLEAFDADMRKQGRSVCLYLDNCSAHHVEDISLTNVRIIFFPPNCTSVIQPLDQGVIKSVKAAYRGRLIRKMLLNMERQRPTEINLFMALEMLAAAWTATSSSVIENCFRHAGFGRLASAASPAPEVNVHEGSADLQPLTEAWDALRSAGDSVPDIVELDDFLCADADVIVHEEFSDDAIIDSVRPEPDTDDEDDGDGEREEKRKVNPRDVLDAFDVIRNFLGENDDDEAMSSLTSCEARVVKLLQSKAKQTKISDYFH